MPLISHTDMAEIGPRLQQRFLGAHEDSQKAALSSVCRLNICAAPGKSVAVHQLLGSCASSSRACTQGRSWEMQGSTCRLTATVGGVSAVIAYLRELPVDLHGRSIVEQQRSHSGQ